MTDKAIHSGKELDAITVQMLIEIGEFAQEHNLCDECLALNIVMQLLSAIMQSNNVPYKEVVDRLSLVKALVSANRTVIRADAAVVREDKNVH